MASRGTFPALPSRARLKNRKSSASRSSRRNTETAKSGSDTRGPAPGSPAMTPHPGRAPGALTTGRTPVGASTAGRAIVVSPAATANGADAAIRPGSQRTEVSFPLRPSTSKPCPAGDGPTSRAKPSTIIHREAGSKPAASEPSFEHCLPIEVAQHKVDAHGRAQRAFLFENADKIRRKFRAREAGILQLDAQTVLHSRLDTKSGRSGEEFHVNDPG